MYTYWQSPFRFDYPCSKGSIRLASLTTGLPETVALLYISLLVIQPCHDPSALSLYLLHSQSRSQCDKDGKDCTKANLDLVTTISGLLRGGGRFSRRA